MAKAATKAPVGSPAARAQAKPTGSKLRKGTGSKRMNNRLITIYGEPKSRKTGAAAMLPLGKTKWVISDSNAVPTLRALGRLPADEDMYEVKSLAELEALIDEMFVIVDEAIAAGKDPTEALGFLYLCIDSYTSFSDWLQADVATETNQTHLGQREGEGWQQFNASFGRVLDKLSMLTNYVTVVGICHAKEKYDGKKGQWGGLALPPQMSLKLGRLSNWILFKTFGEINDTAGVEVDEYISKTVSRGETRYFESVIHTAPYGIWSASMNYEVEEKDGELVSINGIRAEEPGDLWKLMLKEKVAVEEE